MVFHTKITYFLNKGIGLVNPLLIGCFERRYYCPPQCDGWGHTQEAACQVTAVLV